VNHGESIFHILFHYIIFTNIITAYYTPENIYLSGIPLTSRRGSTATSGKKAISRHEKWWFHQPTCWSNGNIMRYHGIIGGQIWLQQKTSQRHWNDGLNIYIYIIYIYTYYIYIYTHIIYDIYMGKHLGMGKCPKIFRQSHQDSAWLLKFWLTRLTLCISLSQFELQFTWEYIYR
jgi:hypothetical protein